MWRKGPLQMLVGLFLMGLVPVLVKGARVVGWGSPHTVTARFVIACIGVLCIAALSKESLRPKRFGLWLLRGLLGGASVLTFYTSVQLAGAGVGTLLNYTYPFWANAITVLVLKQQPVRGFWWLLGLALFGVYLVVDPRFGALSLGEMVGISSGIIAGAAVVCLKELRKTDRTLSIVWSFSLIGLLMASPLALYQSSGHFDELPVSSAMGWLCLGGTGIFSLLAQLFFTRAYKHTSIQLGSMLALMVPVAAALSGWLVFDEPLSREFVLGGGLILLASALLGRLEFKRALVAEAPV